MSEIEYVDIVAIDGPAGSGKSTVALLVARRLGREYIDTGAMYRALTYAAISRKISFSDIEAMTNLAKKCNVDLKHAKVFLDGEDVSEVIRSREVTASVSAVSAIANVRIQCVLKQQLLGTKTPSVLEGRDIGTTVFPRARYKFFLIADARERALRRHLELKSKGQSVSVDDLVMQICARDEADSTRKSSPLKRAVDAIEVDTTKMSIDEVVEFIVSEIQ